MTDRDPIIVMQCGEGWPLGPVPSREEMALRVTLNLLERKFSSQDSIQYGVEIADNLIKRLMETAPK